jgi:hypothetical protein
MDIGETGDWEHFRPTVIQAAADCITRFRLWAPASVSVVHIRLLACAGDKIAAANNMVNHFIAGEKLQTGSTSSPRKQLKSPEMGLETN